MHIHVVSTMHVHLVLHGPIGIKAIHGMELIISVGHGYSNVHLLRKWGVLQCASIRNGLLAVRIIQGSTVVIKQTSLIDLF